MKYTQIMEMRKEDGVPIDESEGALRLLRGCGSSHLHIYIHPVGATARETGGFGCHTSRIYTAVSRLIL